jgi:hypothetical protein
LRRQQAQRFGRRPGFAAHFEPAGLLEHRPQPNAYDGVIVDDQDTRHAPPNSTLMTCALNKDSIGQDW